MGCSCNGHNGNVGCHSNNTTVGCQGNSNTTGCHSHNATNGCLNHNNSCSSHAGYVGPRTITYTNVDVIAGEVIDLEYELDELQHELNVEADRRNIAGAPIDVLHGVVDTSEIRTIRDLFIDVISGTVQSPYSDNEIAPEELITHETVEAMKDQLKSDVATTCACDCNYSCTCHCNYSCTCDCNYCTCDCNYCTCNCNYSCTCDCNYSDMRLKVNIIYF